MSSLAHALAPYRALFDSRVREELQYRAAAIAGLITQVVFGFILIMVLLAFYRASEVESPLSIPQTLAYVWLGQALLGLLPWNVEPRARVSIRSGDVVQQLLRPIEVYRMWFADALAWRMVRTTLRFGPMVALAVLLFPRIGLAHVSMPLPASGRAVAMFLLAVLLAALLSTALTLLIQVSMLWTVTPEGVLYMIPAITIFFSGGLVPLPLFPEWMQPLMAVQPLRGLVDTPSRIYGGELVGMEAWSALGWSALWIVAVVLVGRWAMKHGLRRMVLAGG